MSAIVSVLSHNFGIGYKGKRCKPLVARARFHRLTTGTGPQRNLLVMGYGTYRSLQTFPLAGRHSVVITRRHLPEVLARAHADTTPLASFVELEDFLKRFRHAYNEVWYVGGANIYEQAVRRGLVHTVHVTEVCSDAAADRFFDKTLLKNATVVYSKLGSHAMHKTYELDNNQEEKAYLALLQRLLQQPARSTRSGLTRALFGETLHFDLSQNGFPMLTTKRMPTKSQTIEKELLFFLRGQTDVSLLQAQGVRIWDKNTTEEFLQGKDLLKNDMGPLYGFNWRHFGAPYGTCKDDYKGRGHDQLRRLVHSLRREPTSRRHIMTSFDPSTADAACLYPCHSIVVQCFVREGFLDLAQYQRSADAFLGLPFNIASSALLLVLLAQQAGLRAGKLTLHLGDVHLYATHEAVARVQVQRQPLHFPQYRVDPQTELEGYELKHFHIQRYRCHGRLVAPMAV